MPVGTQYNKHTHRHNIMSKLVAKGEGATSKLVEEKTMLLPLKLLKRMLAASINTTEVDQRLSELGDDPDNLRKQLVHLIKNDKLYIYSEKDMSNERQELGVFLQRNVPDKNKIIFEFDHKSWGDGWGGDWDTMSTNKTRYMILTVEDNQGNQGYQGNQVNQGNQGNPGNRPGNDGVVRGDDDDDNNDNRNEGNEGHMGNMDNMGYQGQQNESANSISANRLVVRILETISEEHYMGYPFQDTFKMKMKKPKTNYSLYHMIALHPKLIERLVLILGSYEELLKMVQ